MKRTEEKTISILLKEWQTCGESVTIFAKRKGIMRSTFYYWIRKHQMLPLKKGPTGGFQSIIVDEQDIPNTTHPTAVIHYPSGARLELHTPLKASFLRLLVG
jgi:hypothetical protein